MAVAAEATSPDARADLGAGPRARPRAATRSPCAHRSSTTARRRSRAFLKLRDGGPCFLLESAEQGRLGRYSFLGFSPRAVLRWNDGALDEWPDDGSGPANPSGGTDAPDPYRAVSEYLGRYRVAGRRPAAFAGGAVGFFGYDLVRTVEPLGEPNPDPIGLPDMALMVSDLLVVFDHMRHELTLLAYAFLDAETGLEAAYAKAVDTIGEARERLRGPVPRPASRAPASPARTPTVPRFESNMTREAFEANVQRIIEYVHAGDAFQVVPSQRFTAELPSRRSRSTAACGRSTPRHTCTSWISATSSSPAPRRSPWSRSPGAPSRRARSRAPIRAARARRRTAAARALLLRSQGARRARDARRPRPQRPRPGLRVRLGRGRRADGGRDLLPRAPHRQPGLRHAARGRQRDGCAARRPAGGHALRRPEGPRHADHRRARATQARAPTAGAIGYLGFTGDLDTAIHIRTVVVKDGLVHVQAGGGTVADAKPDYEYESR